MPVTTPKSFLRVAESVPVPLHSTASTFDFCCSDTAAVNQSQDCHTNWSTVMESNQSSQGLQPSACATLRTVLKNSCWIRASVFALSVRCSATELTRGMENQLLSNLLDGLACSRISAVPRPNSVSPRRGFDTQIGASCR